MKGGWVKRGRGGSEGLLVPSESYPMLTVVLLILCTSVAAVHKPFTVRLCWPLDPQTMPPPSQIPGSISANKYTYTCTHYATYSIHCTCAHKWCVHHLHTDFIFQYNPSRLLCVGFPCASRKVGYTCRAHVLFSSCTGTNSKHLGIQHCTELPLRPGTRMHTRQRERQHLSAVKMDDWLTQSECHYQTPEMKQQRSRWAKVHWCTTRDEKLPCSQWGETENLRNMAALCCNASTLLRAVLSLPLFIISWNKTPAMHCLWGKKLCVLASVREYIEVRVLVWWRMYCVCTSLPP